MTLAQASLELQPPLEGLVPRGWAPRAALPRQVQAVPWPRETQPAPAPASPPLTRAVLVPLPWAPATSSEDPSSATSTQLTLWEALGLAPSKGLVRVGCHGDRSSSIPREQMGTTVEVCS